MNDEQHVLPIATGFYGPTNGMHKEQGHIKRMLQPITEKRELVL
jgi:hypothetical protein